MRPPYRSTRGLRNPNPRRALSPPRAPSPFRAPSPPRVPSPPSASSTTTETDEQRARRVRYEILTDRVEAFAVTHRCRRVPVFCTPWGQPRPVEEVAKELLGHYLISLSSNLVIRIVETEAYQAHEPIYSNRFPDPHPNFRSPAGRLISYDLAFGNQVMFITAGADNSGDLVLLRTCSTIFGNTEIAERVQPTPPVTEQDMVNLLSGPFRVAKGLAPELGDNCHLLTPRRGLYLVLTNEPHLLIKLDGPRVLPRDTAYRRYSAMPGFNNRFRFAFECGQTFPLRSSLRRAVNQP